ncbi:DNA-binding virion core protein [Cetacean poxvirus 1]|nr:DNA-binding virion core protein [Cetacean poxvirus 1]
MVEFISGLFEYDITFNAGCNYICEDSYDNVQTYIAGARAKYPKSFLSIFNIVPRVMTKYDLKLMHNEIITGAVITTAYNVKRNLGICDESLKIDSIDNYFLDVNNEVMTLMINNTNLSCVINKKKGGRRVKNPVIFRIGSVPMMLIFESRKKVNIYIEDTTKCTPDNAYVNIGDNIALVNKYAGIYLLDVHTPSANMKLTGLYGFINGQELKKISSDCELDEYMKKSLTEPIRMDDFIELFESVKKNIPLTNLSITE